MIENLILVFHVLTALAVIGLILLQQGKGADAGASFGSGSSQTVFGASGGAGALVKATGLLAAIFFATSLTLAYYARLQAESVGQVEPVVSEAIVEEVNNQGDIPELSAPTVNAVESDIPAVPASVEAESDVPAAE